MRFRHPRTTRSSLLTAGGLGAFGGSRLGCTDLVARSRNYLADDKSIPQRPRWADPAHTSNRQCEARDAAGGLANPKKGVEILGISVGPHLDTAVDLTDFVSGLRASGWSASNGPVDNRENTSMSGATDTIAIESPVSQSPARMGTAVS